MGVLDDGRNNCIDSNLFCSQLQSEIVNERMNPGIRGRIVTGRSRADRLERPYGSCLDDRPTASVLHCFCG